jgi:hypothetical protein
MVTLCSDISTTSVAEPYDDVTAGRPHATLPEIRRGTHNF